MRLETLSLAAATVLVFPATALAGLVNTDFSFDDDGDALGNGQRINGDAGEFGVLFDLSSSGNNAGLGIFDTTPGVNGADRDLWVDSGNALILQKSGSTFSGDFWDDPNDDADGGTIVFDFLAAVTLQSITLIDIDDSGQDVNLLLADGMGRLRQYLVPDNWTGDVDQGEPGFGTLDLTTTDDQAGFDSVSTLR